MKENMFISICDISKETYSSILKHVHKVASTKHTYQTYGF